MKKEFKIKNKTIDVKDATTQYMIANVVLEIGKAIINKNSIKELEGDYKMYYDKYCEMISKDINEVKSDKSYNKECKKKLLGEYETEKTAVWSVFNWLAENKIKLVK